MKPAMELKYRREVARKARIHLEQTTIEALRANNAHGLSFSCAPHCLSCRTNAREILSAVVPEIVEACIHAVVGLYKPVTNSRTQAIADTVGVAILQMEPLKESLVPKAKP